ncbi:exodeoxyribonuclease VII small subunit [Mesoplasma lactucae]|uniref:Exodeoxyribonuclease VII small subunit n=1 Tax=Mesoplasma lactucae ATCC 49193 TaxID=81460 RepID=A0A291IRK4_9MOLU|nr:exodeoxyribonuclease VII small subunit [Mesoplasma lactucae]ATG97390.1 exodeoxyribonuclease VII small subunit [Mesoplasma lactucae ATCC 49193]ATZ20157.1 exodeoxyribonuclease VII small subunit [Mesoplasma lactucae ATCC 49193]MCL8216906.1 Exodeoxyribonuclease 7 small subunit [Mesoplasma lactucae ATCC 49193]
MENKDKSFDELMNETNQYINKLNSNDITMDEAMKLFELGVKNLNEAKAKLSENKAKIQKVLEDNKLEDFN